MTADWKDLLLWLNSQPTPQPEDVRARLKATRMEWTEMDPRVRAETIKKLLDSGEDAATGVDFRVGLHGFLKGSPTLRVFLLDVLATSDPEMAMAIVRPLLDQTSSAEEYAVALRSLTRDGIGRAEDAELLTRFGRMLGREEWQGSPGFAEALDLARYVGSEEAARQLAKWNGNPLLKSMALDEFTAQHPGVMSGVLITDSNIKSSDRATLMARANPEDPQQLAAVDAYLRSPERSPEEAAAFLETFPLRSVTTGFRLYAETPAPYTHERIVAGDLIALEQVNAWVKDPALEKYHAGLLPLQERLANWTKQAR